MGGCSAPNCTNNTSHNIRVFIFPRDPDRRAKWLKMCRRDNWEPTPYSTICEVHFEESQFESARKDGWKKLKPNAVPTIFDLPKCLKPKRRRPLIRLAADEELPGVSSFAEVEKPSGVVPEVLHAEVLPTEELQVHSPQSSEVSYLPEVSSPQSYEVSSPQSSEVSLSQSSEVSERELLLISKIAKLERKLRLKEKALQTTRAELYQMRRKFATLPCLHLTRVDASSHGEKGRLGQRS